MTVTQLQLAIPSPDALFAHSSPAANMITAQTIASFEALHNHAPLMRTSTKGNELDMVERYLAQWLAQSSDHTNLTIFVEPKLQSGYPDVVAVYWDPLISAQWPKARCELTPLDIRIAHHAYMARKVDMPQLKAIAPGRKLDAALTRLVDAGIFTQGKTTLLQRPLKDIFAVRRLVAIEAKISAAQRGLDQAFQNTWFASESYLLVPALPKNPNFLDAAKRLGVGVLEETTPIEKSAVRARRDRIPKSYPSWLFNEWAWRATL